ncbi:MAG TPA: Gfo/Idh/MocA family oxidoreductase, partial [Chloroflexota bacterium]|nr:Gfo/Idh/MocA family oxidoreductase [Chloroflexota bacterium]
GNIEAAAEAPADRARITTDVAGLAADLTVESVRGDWTDYYQNIADTLAGRANLAVTGEQVRRSIAVFDAAYLASRIGETVRVTI